MWPTADDRPTSVDEKLSSTERMNVARRRARSALVQFFPGKCTTVEYIAAQFSVENSAKFHNSSLRNSVVRWS